MPSPGHVVTEIAERQGKALPHSEKCPTCRERPPYTPAEMADRERAMAAQRKTPRQSSSAERPGKRRLPGADEPKVWFEEEVSGGE
jgi:hypothetical protein